MDIVTNKLEDNSNKRNFTIRTVYSIFIAFLPLFGIYYSGIPGLNVGEMILLIFTTLCIFNNFTKKNPVKEKVTDLFIILICYLIFSSLFSILLRGYSAQIKDIMIRTMRFSFFVICVVITSKYYFNAKIASNWITKISIFSSIYIIIQYLFYYLLNIILVGIIPFIPIYSAGIYKNSYNNIKNFYRPASFFLEPSHFVQYVVVGLVLLLFSKKVTRFKNIINALIISIGMILSTSIQGIVILAVVWICWGLSLVKRRITIRNLIYIMFYITGLPFLIILVSNTTVIKHTLSRLMDSNNILTSNAFIARFQGYSYFTNVPDTFKFIGFGFGSIPNSNIFMSSFAYILYGGGYIGLFIIMMLFLNIFFKSKKNVTKVLIIVTFILLTATEWLYIYISVFYFSLICYEDN